MDDKQPQEPIETIGTASLIEGEPKQLTEAEKARIEEIDRELKELAQTEEGNIAFLKRKRELRQEYDRIYETTFYTTTSYNISDGKKRPTTPKGSLPVYRFTEVQKEDEKGNVVEVEDTFKASPAPTITASSSNIAITDEVKDQLLTIIEQRFDGIDKDILKDYVNGRYHSGQKDLAEKYHLSKGEISKTLSTFRKIVEESRISGFFDVEAS